MAENTQSFKWTGINSAGKRTEGVLQASEMKDAQSELKKMGIEIVSITPKAGKSRKAKKIKIKDIQLFTRYLSTMLASGLPILQALDIIAQDQENPNMRTLIINLRNDIAGGKTMAETFSKYPKQFNELYCNLIKAGEKSGTLDKILNRLAGYLEKNEVLKRKIKKAMTYPIAVLSIAFIVSGILLIFVVPQFQAMFESFGAKLPLFTRMIVNLSNFMRAYWWVIILGIGGLVVFWKYSLSQNKLFLEKMDAWKLKIPVVGGVLRKGIIARFTRTLSTTLEAGMPIVESMRATAPIMDNEVYIRGVMRMVDDITNGHTLAASMTATKLFPNMVLQMIAIGEASGKLSDMLNKIADYYDDEVNLVVDSLSSLLEPLIMLILGGIVGVFVIAMYLPIFKMGDLMK